MMRRGSGSHLRSLSLRVGVWHPNTRIRGRLLGPCFKTGRRRPLRQHPCGVRVPRPGTGHGAAGYKHSLRSHIPPAFIPRAEPMLACARQSAPGPRAWVTCRAQVWSRALPFQQFHVLFNPLSKVLFIFRSLYLCAIGLWPVFSFRRHIPPTLSSIPKLLDSSKEPYAGLASDLTGLSPSVASRSRELGRRRAQGILCRLQLGSPAGGPDFKSELLPLHSPLLGQSLLVSFPPLIDMLKFSGWSCLIRGQRVLHRRLCGFALRVSKALRGSSRPALGA